MNPLNQKEPPSKPGRKHIMIVDDDEEIRNLLRIRLEAEGFSVSMVEDGDKAVEAVQKQEPDLVIMDVMMPNLDGITTLKQMNQMRKEKIPVVIVTGSSIVWEDEFRMEGARAFMRKPFDSNQLARHVKEILKA